MFWTMAVTVRGKAVSWDVSYFSYPVRISRDGRTKYLLLQESTGMIASVDEGVVDDDTQWAGPSQRRVQAEGELWNSVCTGGVDGLS